MFMDEMEFLAALNLTQDYNVIPVMELSTRDPHSRTVSAIADELLTSLASIVAIASTLGFIDHLARKHDDTKKSSRATPFMMIHTCTWP
jgi:hypothetical protein